MDLRQAAERWIATNPGAMALFRRFAGEMVQRQRRFGMRLLAERVRWECAVQTVDDGDYKINDHYTPYIGRHLCQEMPELRGLLEMRSTKW